MSRPMMKRYRYSTKSPGAAMEASNVKRVLAMKRTYSEIWVWRVANLYLCWVFVTSSLAGDIEEERPNLQSGAKTFGRAGAARCNYLNAHRPQVTFSTKELCRAVVSPEMSDIFALQWLCRGHRDRPKMVQTIPTGRRTVGTKLKMHVDRDCVDCRKPKNRPTKDVLSRETHV